MERKAYFERGGLLTGVGGFIATIPTLAPVPGPVIAATVLTATGIGVGLIGVMLVIVPFLPRWEESYPTVRRVSRGDLKQVYSFCNGMFGDNFSSFNNIKRWFNHNGHMFWIVEKIRRKGPARLHRVTGFFSVLPLTSEGKRLLLDGQVQGTGFAVDHIASDFSQPAAYYIGAIASNGGKSKGVALGALIERMNQFVEVASAPVYTRPTTKDGLRLARQQGFEAVDGSGTRDMNKLYIRAD